MEDYGPIRAEYYDANAAGSDWGGFEFYLDHAKGCDTVLELGCGTGLIAIPIAHEGVSVTGLDISPHMLEIARSKVDQLPDDVRERITLVEGSMIDFQLGKEFDLVIIPARAFNHILTPEEQAGVLNSAFSHLRVQGRLILDIFGASRTKSRKEASSCLEKGREFPSPLSSNRIMSFGGLVEHDPQTQIETYAQVFKEVDEEGTTVQEHHAGFRTRYTFPDEMEDLFISHGFQIVDSFSNFSGLPLGDGGGNQIYIVEKSPELTALKE